MSKVIRVLHICGSITTSGGVGTFLMNYYRNVDREKVQFDFLTHQDTEECLVEEINKMGGNVIKITPKSLNLLRNIKETFELINRKSPHDIIHIHTASTTSFMYLLIAKIAKKRLRIIHSHATDLEKPKGSFQHKIHNILRPIMLASATNLFACSQAAGIWLYGEKNLNKVKVIKNAIDAQKFIYSEKKALEKKKEMNIEGKLVIGNIGRFAYPKNHHFLLEIFRELNKLNPSIVLLLIGSGELLEEIKQKTTDLKLHDKVEFLGIRNDIPELLCAMDLFLLPSKFEGLPVSLIEAQASGLRIVATDTISKEVEITDLVIRLPLTESPLFWAEKILDESKKNCRKNTHDVIVANGYDIKYNSKWLEEFYLQGGKLI